ncbi:hypothetical protein FBQ96_10330 [Nitrospirales bacterium NOB]|nr:MAG: DSBA-like thioredoxin domain protein [Nitrospira sp. OLB3]MBV6469091.1 hypothetical protein [Nitrospirota bacterium]MCE7965941.1 hypothetical protein [Nitrospira sp. NTP2]MCK6493293.1 DsbA family protein [Nitrospira sp.]MDL1889960.1 hypothetical protein [Nitrospirales bacterium NOB]MEB2338473.1 DsbA family protein [Nitrospirales bacterium]
MNEVRLYSDFNCPFCYALHERLHGLGLLDRVLWQGVQHAPHLSLPMATWGGPLAAELRQEVELIRRLAPEVPIRVPSGKPNTKRAIAAAARAVQQDRSRGLVFARALYRSFWLEGKDLSDEEVLREAARRSELAPTEVVGPAALSVDSLLWTWQEQWTETDHAGVPLLERQDQSILVGLVPTESLRAFLHD